MASFHAILYVSSVFGHGIPGQNPGTGDRIHRGLSGTETRRRIQRRDVRLPFGQEADEKDQGGRFRPEHKDYLLGSMDGQEGRVGKDFFFCERYGNGIHHGGTGA